MSSLTFDNKFKGRYKSFGVLGEYAENAFIQWSKEKNIEAERYGFDKSGIRQFWKIPIRIRKTPDFICYGTRPFFCETKGKGRAAHTKVKHEDLEALIEWDKDLDVWLFFYDSHRQQICFVDLMTIIELSKNSKTDMFDGKTPYYKIADSALTWEPFKPQEKYIGY